MKYLVVFAMFFLLALPAAAQTATPGTRDELRERALKRCRENRGINCDTKEGLREWIREERPATDGARQGAAARRHREECKRNKNNPTC